MFTPPRRFRPAPLLMAAAGLALSFAAGCSSEDLPPGPTPGNAPYFLRLTSTTEAETSPAFSPDGARVAYEVQGEIWVLEVATRSTSRVAPHGNHPSWSSDGAALLFA